jgi:hypothetical protein
MEIDKNVKLGHFPIKTNVSDISRLGYEFYKYYSY